MAGVRFKCVTGEQTTGTSQKTLLQLVAASNHGVLIDEWGISFKGVSNTGTPIRVLLIRQSTAIGGTPASNDPVKDPDDSDETLQTTGFVPDVSPSEPTTVTTIASVLVHPQTGYTWQAPWGREIKIGGGDRLGIVVVAAEAVNAICHMNGTE